MTLNTHGKLHAPYPNKATYSACDDMGIKCVGIATIIVINFLAFISEQLQIFHVRG